MEREIFFGKRKLCSARYITDVFGKARGMMFRLRPVPLLFVCSDEEFIPLHMWFVFFPIDVIYLDSKKQIVEVIERFYPFMAHIPLTKAKYVLEVPTGTIKKNRISVGKKLSFQG